MQRPRALRLLPLALLVPLLLEATPSTAVEIDLNWGGLFTDTTFATPVAGFTITPDGDGASFVQPQAGQGLLLTIDVGNAAGANIRWLFTSLVVDSSKYSLLGGFNRPDILEGGTRLDPTGLVSLASPGSKGNSPAPPSETWIQSLGCGPVSVGNGIPGTTETGPQIGVSRIFFEILSPDAFSSLPFQALTEGDTVEGPSGSLPVEFDDIFLVPEPGTALLIGLGLALTARR